jgi:hypothetical protein
MLGGRTTRVALYARVFNNGAPSVAVDWKVSAVLSDGRLCVGDNEWINRITLYSDAGPSQIFVPGSTSGHGEKVITATDALYQKTMTPIPTGGVTAGFFLVSFAGLSTGDLQSIGAKIILEFHDALYQLYSCTLVVKDSFIQVGKSQRYAGDETAIEQH